MNILGLRSMLIAALYHEYRTQFIYPEVYKIIERLRDNKKIKYLYSVKHHQYNEQIKIPVGEMFYRLYNGVVRLDMIDYDFWYHLIFQD
jgi:hypothetical protein